MIDYLPWLAVLILNAAYWVQIYKIHRHREVRDLAISSYILFGVAYVILAIEAYHIDSTIFLVKNIITFISTSVLIFMVWYHQDDEWHDDDARICNNLACPNEIENQWQFCPDCGASKTLVSELAE